MTLRPLNGWTLNAYMDFYSFPFLRYRVDAPARGRDYLAQLTYKPNKVFELYVRYRNEVKSLNQKNGPFNFAEPKWRQNLRLHFANQVTRNLQLRGRVEMNWFNRKGADREDGFLTYVDGSYQGLRRFSFNGRLQYFETGGYNSRIYAYENDVLYSFSIPPFFNKGLRYYFNVNYDVTKEITVWLRYAATGYHDRETIGSGLDEIKGKQKSELKFQVIYRR